MDERSPEFAPPVVGAEILLIPEAARRIADMLDDNSTWAEDFTREEIETLVRHMTLEEYNDGDSIFNQGDEGGFMCVILKGVVEIIKSACDSEELESRILVKMGPGRAFGEMALVDGAPRSAAAAAVGRVWLLTLDRPGFNAVCEREAALGIKLLKNIARLMSFRLRHTSLRLLTQLQSGDAA